MAIKKKAGHRRNRTRSKKYQAKLRHRSNKKTFRPYKRSAIRRLKRSRKR